MATRSPYATRITFKIDMGLNDLGKTIVSNKSLDNANREANESAFVTLGGMVNDLVEGRGLLTTILTEQDELM